MVSPKMERLLRERKVGRDYQERRHKDWDEIYTLYRNKIFTNRLTQRQAVNIPLMKETVKTLLSKIDDPPTVDWKELSGDQEKEIVFQELWNTAYSDKNFEGIDVQDKKSVILYGRSFKKLNWDKDQVAIQALDIYDAVVDPMCDPLEIETARFVIHQNIFRPLREILADDRYSAEGKKKLKMWAMSPEAMVISGENKEEYERKMDRIRAMGVNSDEFAHFAAGDVVVNLTEHFTRTWNTKKQAFERRVVVYADDHTELMDESLEDLLGITFWPFITWSEDIETADFWSDGPADLVRTPNKVINIWFSQLVENRTLRNFQMHWFDATVEKYKPQTYEPGPGKMLPAPGKPGDVIRPVEISGLDDTLESIDFIIKMVERGTSATAIEKGVTERKQMTLGEVEMLVGKAQERTVAMAKFYRRSWEELAIKWAQIMDANAAKSKKLYKMSAKGVIWPKVVFPSDWKSKAGYKPFVRSSSEQEEDKTQSIQRFQFLLQQFPDNRALKKIAQKRMLEVADLSPEEIREIAEEQKKQEQMLEEQARMQAEMQQMQMQQAGQQPQAVVDPQSQEDSQTNAQLTDLEDLLDVRSAEQKLNELRLA